MLYSTVLGSAVHHHESATDIHMSLGFPRGSDGKNCLQCSRPRADPQSGRSPGGGPATHSSILAWEIPWTEEPGRLWSMGSQRS